MNKIIFTLLISLTIASCGGVNSFHEKARAGDSVALPIGYQPEANKDNFTLTITPSSGPQIVLSATDPAIRGIVNFYPDPISNMIISREISEDLTPFAQTYADRVYDTSKKYKDNYQTTIFLDLPTTLPDGLTLIDISVPVTGIIKSVTLDIIPDATGGDPTTFASDYLADLGDGTQQALSDDMFDSMSRSAHNEITFSFTTLPHAIELDFTHDPDRDVGGTGKTFVVNPVGYLMNTHWSDDGNNLKVILIESQPGIVTRKKDYRFYVAGTTTGLALASISSYDVNGNSLAGATATITPR